MGLIGLVLFAIGSNAKSSEIGRLLLMAALFALAFAATRGLTVHP
jgi:hypothetical protein